MRRAEYEAEKRSGITGVMWRPLRCGGGYLISEKGCVYNFLRGQVLRPCGGSMRLRINGAYQSVTVAQLLRESFPEAFADAEVWRTVVLDGAALDYEVSASGEVRRKSTGRRLTVTTAPNGYCFVHISCGGKDCKVLVHRLVAAAFVPVTIGKGLVRHRDGNRQNNAAGNLVW